ncbi:MAG: [FeFe] hydrogenase H-cluster radical SAM maturase HydG [bacterium]
MKTKIFFDQDKINELIELKPSKNNINEILDKALNLHGLNINEAALLLNVDDNEFLAKIYKAAKIVKEKIYGKRIVLFAPLYLSNFCVNNCLYCAFRKDNTNIKREKLSVDEAIKETCEIINTGHKRILLVAGEDIYKCNLDYIEEIINKIYEQKILNGEIRRLNINIAPLSTDDFKRLNNLGIGTYQSFQETYHRETYKIMHPTGIKSDYDWRIETMDRALEAGLKDVGMGVLFGLTDYRFEVLAMLAHSEYLDKKYGIGPHTISIPRIEPAKGSFISESPPYAVNNQDFKKIVSVLRLSVPYTGIILSTRESSAFRKEVIELGISQISAGSKTNPGGYSSEKNSTEQFLVGDTRTLDEVIYELAKNDYIPSFCTSCYRLGRVGKDFMEFAKPGLIQKFCQPNAILTFKEYLEDYAGEKTRSIGLKIIDKHVSEINDIKTTEKLKTQLKQIELGKRDIYI